MKKILIFGLPGSGKTTLANKVAQKLGCVHLNADKVREKFNDWDFSDAGRERQVLRMKELSEDANGAHVILDFVCPKSAYRRALNADVTVFMDTIKNGRYEDTNSIFEPPLDDESITHTFREFDSDKQAQTLVNELISFDWRMPTVQMLGRWQPFHDGHVALFQRSLAKTGQVCIQVRDCEGWNDSNPFAFEEVKEKITNKLAQHNYQLGNEYIIMMVPNITNITYGRDVGYKIEQEVFDDKIHQISATKIRKELGYNS